MFDPARRDFLKRIACGSAGLLMPGCRSISPARRRPPNIVLILIDDLGWTDLRCQGNRNLETPRIDAFARQGMRFPSAYSAAPVCTPTRAAIMTGQSPARLGITNHAPGNPAFRPEGSSWAQAESLTYLPLDHVTLAERLNAAGYATGFLGKWHLSHRKGGDEHGPFEPRLRAEHQGFDLNIGGCGYGGPPTYFDPYRIPNIEPRKEGEYLTKRLADESIDFIKQHRDEPFFLALWNYTVHWPMEAPPALVEKYRNREGLKDPRYAAMIEEMDRQIGRVLAALDELDLAGDTLVIFTSDNGAFGGVTDLAPLRGCKGHLYEGGIRVPLFVRWPGRVRPDVRCSIPVVSTDLFPTILKAAGLEPEEDRPLDGESLVPLLEQTGSLERDAVCFHYPNYAFHGQNRLGGAIRQGDDKLILWYDDDSVELYDLGEDIGETTDLSRTLPDKAKTLKARLKSWLESSGARMPSRKEE